MLFLMCFGVGVVMADSVCNDLTIFFKRNRLVSVKTQGKLFKSTSVNCAEYCSALKQCPSFHFKNSQNTCFIHKKHNNNPTRNYRMRNLVKTGTITMWGKLQRKLVLCKDTCFSNTGCVESHNIIVCFKAQVSCEKAPFIPHARCQMVSKHDPGSGWRCRCKKGYTNLAKRKKWIRSSAPTIVKCDGFWRRNLLSCQRNIAFKKRTKQSSGSMGRPSHQAVDGNTVMDLIKGTCSSTNLETAPWWQVDLGAVYNIRDIVIYNRVDCCWNRLDRLTIFVGNKTKSRIKWKTCFRQRRTTPKGRSLVSCNQHSTGQVVKISIRNGSPLTLCEIEIYENMKKL